MTRPRRRTAYDVDLRPKTSRSTFTAAADALTARGWRDGETFRMRPTATSADELLIAPIVGGNDQAPGSGGIEWQEGQKAEWHAALRRLTAHMAEAGWTVHGSCNDGTYFSRPASPAADDAPDAAELAAAPPGAPIRLLAFAAEVGIGDGDLDAAVREAAHDAAADAYNTGARPELDDDRALYAVHAEADHQASEINIKGLAAQLAFLYEGCVSEAAFRSLLSDLRNGSDAE